MDGQFLIYGLFDPRNDELRYVGKSVSGLTRPKAHLFPSQLRAHTHKNNWIKSLQVRDMKPEVVILEETNRESLQELEKCAIQHYREMGFRLTNLTDGGEGCTGRKLSPEARAKISAAQKGRVRSEETRKKTSESQKKRFQANPVSEEQLLKMRIGLASRSPGESQAAHKRAAKALAESNHNRIWSEESRKKLSESNKTRRAMPPNPATFSAETKAKMSASAKARWERNRLAKGLEA